MYKFVRNVLIAAFAMLCCSACVYANSEFCISGAMITEYNGNADVVTVPAVIDGVVIAGIDSYAFENKDMHTVIIEEGIEVIQPKAFVGCDNLQYVKSPESMLLINENAFFECSPTLQLDASDNTYVMDNEVASAELSSETETEPEYENYNGFLYDGNTITGYVGEDTEIVIPESINEVTIVEIAANAFEDNTAITKVTIPDTVTTIGNAAFKGCTSLSELSLTKKLSSAGVEVFSGCSALKSITIPGTLKRVSKNMFYECRSLTSVVLEHGVNKVGPYAFYNCVNIETVQVPETITMLETWCFGYCEKLESFYIPYGCTFVDSAVFYYCTVLNNVCIPDTVTTVGTHCFRACSSLSNLTLSKKLTSIQYRVFNGCAFSDMEIPDSVTSIGSEAFYQCSRLQKLEIPASVKSIGAGAFFGCTALDMMIVYGADTTLGKIFTFGGNTSIGENTMLYLVANSVAEQSAKENGLPYIPMSGTANVVKSFISVNGTELVSDSGTVLVEDDTAYVKYTVINVGEESQNLRLLICLYDENGRFMKVACSLPESVAVNSFKEIGVNMRIDFETETDVDTEDDAVEAVDDTEIDDNNTETDDTATPSGKYYAKVILLDSLNQLVPLFAAKEI